MASLQRSTVFYQGLSFSRGHLELRAKQSLTKNNICSVISPHTVSSKVSANCFRSAVSQAVLEGASHEFSPGLMVSLLCIL